MEVHEKLAKLRTRSGLSQKEFCERVKKETGKTIYQSRVSKWENAAINRQGEATPLRIEPSALKIYADFFNVSLEYLCNDEWEEDHAPDTNRDIESRFVASLDHDKRLLWEMVQTYGAAAILAKITGLSPAPSAASSSGGTSSGGGPRIVSGSAAPAAKPTAAKPNKKTATAPLALPQLPLPLTGPGNAAQ
jgi:transcriptional regulator with XRE-family HTH domain